MTFEEEEMPQSLHYEASYSLSWLQQRPSPYFTGTVTDSLSPTTSRTMMENKVSSIPSLATRKYFRGDYVDVWTTVLQKTKDLDCVVLLNINAYSIFPCWMLQVSHGEALPHTVNIDQLVMGLMRGRKSRQALNEIIWIMSLVCNKLESNIPEKAIGDKIIISNDLKTVPVRLSSCHPYRYANL